MLPMHISRFQSPTVIFIKLQILKIPIAKFLLTALEAFLKLRMTELRMAMNIDGANEAKVGWVWGMSNRSTFDVLWTCLSVILVCTYKVIHLNLPACKEAEASWDQLLFWKKWLRKLKWMSFMALSPELLLAMALSDFEWSRRLERRFARTGANYKSSLRPSTLEADAIDFVEEGKATSRERSKSNTPSVQYA